MLQNAVQFSSAKLLPFSVAAMDAKLLVFVATSLFISASLSHATKSFPTIIVMGVVYCDICSNNTFSRHSYFLPGVKVHMDCELNANSPTTTERLSFSVNRTTDRFGVYKLEIPSVDGFRCAEGPAIQTFCKASLIGSSTSSCNVPGLKTTEEEEMVIKSKQVNLCIYSLGVLNYRPSKRETMLCVKNYREDDLSYPLKSKFSTPYLPSPFGFPLP